jgi:SAM-dependent methyltransferase
MNFYQKKFESKSQLDFLDIGCSNGTGYDYLRRNFGDSGLCIDIDPEKVKNALKRGVPAVQLDACNVDIFSDNSCKVVSIMHVLEHLPNTETVNGILKESSRIASNTIYIRGPMFYEKYLSELGLQFYWSSWTGHSCHIEPEKIIELAKTHIPKNSFKHKLNYRSEVKTSADSCVHPLNGKIDRHDYNPKKDPPKNNNIKLENIYKEFELYIHLK